MIRVTNGHVGRLDTPTHKGSQTTAHGNRFYINIHLARTTLMTVLLTLLLWGGSLSVVPVPGGNISLGPGVLFAAEDHIDDETDDIDALDDLFSDDGTVDSDVSYRRDHRVADPLSGFNRVMFSFNDKFYFYLLKPVAKGYQAVTPQFFRVGIRNMFVNALFPLRCVNNVLQGKFSRSFDEGKVFVLNTVVGGLGFATPAQDYFGLEIHDEDLGQTLGHYGVGEGLYLVLPLLGPSTARDLVGSAGDMFLNPITYIESTDLAVGLKVLDTVNGASFRLGEYEALKAAALDPYVALKDAYLQMRTKKIEK